MKKELGLYRLEKKPMGIRHKLYYYTDSKNHEVTKEEYDKFKLEESPRRKLYKKETSITDPFPRQQLWYITEDISDQYIPIRKWVFAKYAKSVTLEEWKSYPFYDGIIFDKKG